MTSTSDAAAAALVELEVYGVTLMRYLSVMGMVLVLYDFLLTLDDEVWLIFCFCFVIHLTACSQMRLVWPGTLHWPKALFYINRYVSFFGMIYSNYR